MLPVKVHRYIFLIATILLVIGLPVSYFLLSSAQILLSVNWLLEGNFKRKLKIIAQRKSILLLLSIYIIHIIWLFNTIDLTYALHDIRIKLPLFALPIIYGTSDPFTKKEFNIIIRFFIATVFVSSLITSYIILGFSRIDPVDSRYASLFISHIRFALIVVLTIYTILYTVFFQFTSYTLNEKIVFIAIMLWLIAFLVLLRSFTGIIIFIALTPLSIIWWSYQQNKISYEILSYLISFILLIGVVYYGFYSWQRFNKRYNIEFENLDKYTANGNSYINQKDCDEYENGYQIWIYISLEELENEWKRISEFPFDSLDRKRQKIKVTMIRYLTSLGYRKDSSGLAALSKTDVDMIEKGYTNYLQKNKFSLYPRIYELLWEIERYKKTGNPNGQSLAQRIEYLKTGINIVKRKFWLGTGTGDVADEFTEQYELDGSILKKELQHRTHNQFITFFLTFGIFGFLWFLFALFTPPLLEKKYRNLLFLIFFLIAALSMMNEDTLETHVGVSFFAFFYSFLLFSMPDKEEVND
ncbi:MAG: O-antigen ligase family protein [Bacteroidales bacterium]|nr:O-antigen ligase family protein [Bacteroidales bacterium]